MEAFESRYAVTFGEMPNTHDPHLERHPVEHSFSVDDLLLIQKRLVNLSLMCDIVKLESSLPEQMIQENRAAVLIVRDFANFLLQDQEGANKLYNEQETVEYDRKYYDRVMKKTFNRKARYHMIFGDRPRQPSQEFKEYTITGFQDLQLLAQVRRKLGEYFRVDDKMSEQYISSYYAEGVHYYDQASGLGFHGDDGRKVVIGLCLGRTTTLRYCWRSPHSTRNDEFDPIDMVLHHGDVYIMSEKATGNDWKKRSRFRVVHGAGADKFIKI